MLCIDEMFYILAVGSIILNSVVVPSSGTALTDGTSRDAAEHDALLEKNHNCKCVKYYLCDEDNYIIKDGATLIEIRNPFHKVHDLICKQLDENMPQYCCFLRPQNIDQPENVDQRFEPTLVSNPSSNAQKCGHRSIQDSAITTEAQDGEYPWMAAVYVKNHFVCSGALIHPNVVLTAAHYVYRVKNKTNLRVFVGGGILPRSRLNEERKVVEFLKHPDYKPDGLLHNDISLLILDQPYTLSEKVNVLCLPTPSLSFENVRCETSGWNRKGEEEDIDPDDLHKVSLPFVHHDKCQQQLRTYTELGPKFDLHESFICAGGEKGKDVCKGDGGSPLVCKKGEEFYFVGIVSWGKGCNQENVPGAYTNVARYMEWIYNELFKRNIIII